MTTKADKRGAELALTVVDLQARIAQVEAANTRLAAALREINSIEGGKYPSVEKIVAECSTSETKDGKA